MTNDQTLVNALSTNWHIAQLTPADHAMLSYCETLTSTPSEMGEQDIAHLRDAGFSDNAQGLALPQVERDVGHCVDHTVATDWEFLDEVLHPEDDVLAATELDGAATSHQACSAGPSTTAPAGTPE